MQHEITASLIDHLRAKTGMNVVWVFDGVKLPVVKPFITVEQMPSSESVVSKMRDAARSIYRFQVGLHTQSMTERTRKQDEIKRIFVFDTFDLLDTTQIPAPVIGSFCVDLTGITPISPESVSDTTNYHKVYFDIEIDVNYYG